MIWIPPNAGATVSYVRAILFYHVWGALNDKSQDWASGNPDN